MRRAGGRRSGAARPPSILRAPGGQPGHQRVQLPTAAPAAGTGSRPSRRRANSAAFKPTRRAPSRPWSSASRSIKRRTGGVARPPCARLFSANVHAATRPARWPCPAKTAAAVGSVPDRPWPGRSSDNSVWRCAASSGRQAAASCAATRRCHAAATRAPAGCPPGRGGAAACQRKPTGVDQSDLLPRFGFRGVACQAHAGTGPALAIMARTSLGFMPHLGHDRSPGPAIAHVPPTTCTAQVERGGVMRGPVAWPACRAPITWLLLRNLHALSIEPLEAGLGVPCRSHAAAGSRCCRPGCPCWHACRCLGRKTWTQLHGPGWAQAAAAAAGGASNTSSAAGNALAATQPALLAAHAYVRYLGDLSGGQMLARIVSQGLQLPARCRAWRSTTSARPSR